MTLRKGRCFAFRSTCVPIPEPLYHIYNEHGEVLKKENSSRFEKDRKHIIIDVLKSAFYSAVRNLHMLIYVMAPIYTYRATCHPTKCSIIICTIAYLGLFILTQDNRQHLSAQQKWASPFLIALHGTDRPSVSMHSACMKAAPSTLLKVAVVHCSGITKLLIMFALIVFFIVSNANCPCPSANRL